MVRSNLLLKLLLRLTVTLLIAVPTTAQDNVAAHFEPLKPYVGKTWRGTFANSTPERPMVDISRWEWALGGQVIRILHSVNDGRYGGETIIVWDAAKEGLVYFYFTTAGFYTTGTMQIEDGKFTTYEEVKGNQQGITAVKAVGEILPDGRFKSTSQYLKDGEWVEGHEILYEEDPHAEVILP